MTYIIAEIGGNHDGDVVKAKQLIREAKQAGADAVKFQIYDASKLVHPELDALKQAKGYDKQINRFKDLELTQKQWRLLISMCNMLGIDFLATCFDLNTLSHYEPDMKYIKIASGDLTYDALIAHAAQFNKPILLSTGMANIDEIRRAYNLIPQSIPVTIMHCVSIYPCADSDANLNVIDYLKNYYKHVGYSDHTMGITACIAASTLRVDVIEKHFTLDNTLDYGDHILSATPDEFAELVQHDRRLNKMRVFNSKAVIEVENAQHFRRGVYSARDIKQGCIINFDDIAVLRPATRTTLDSILGTIAVKNYKQGDSFDGS